jgi:hypothetical protein
MHALNGKKTVSRKRKRKRGYPMNIGFEAGLTGGM